MEKMPVFVRFAKFFATALFAGIFAFISQNSYSATCPSGTKAQTNVFAEQQECSYGYPHTGNSSENSPISSGDGTWTSYFSGYRVKGRAYCSSSVPDNPVAVGKLCPSLPRRAMAETINPNHSGTHCWCQATEHRQASASSGLWTAPFQKIYAKYVYLKDMGDSCETSCAAYCSYMNNNLILNGSSSDPVIGENLRATIYDSLLECIPIENKITYISDGEVIDYQYYDGPVELKNNLVKPNYYFKGWCESQTCDNPIAGGTTQLGWTGEKTLYAQWGLAGCGNGVKSQLIDGELVCSTECDDGYEEQFNPFSAQYDDSAPNEQTFCYRTANTYDTSGTNWTVYFSSFGYTLRGESFCSPTAPNISSTPVRDPDCQSGVIHSMLDEIDTEGTGSYCWCHLTEYERTHANSFISKGKTALDTKYVYAAKPYNCLQDCPSMCNTMARNNAYDGLDGISLRVSIYRSLNKCKKKSYSLTFKDSGNTVQTIPNYTVTDDVSLPTSADLPERPGYTFAGWCEDTPDCDNPITGTQDGLFGDKTLYAKWVAVPYNVEYVTNGAVLSKGALETYTVNEVVELKPTESEALVFEGWYDNPEFEGEPITSLPIMMANAPKTGSVTLYANQSLVPATCANGYEPQDSEYSVLDPNDRTSIVSWRSNSGNQKRGSDRLVPDATLGSSDYYNGLWFALYEDKGIKVSGKSSCTNAYTGTTPPDSMKYSETNAALSTGSNGQYCWCKITDYTVGGTQKETPDTPWIFIKKFDSDYLCTEGYGCTSACAAAVGVAKKTEKDIFFRAQLFGDYSTCKVGVYDINYNLNGGTWDTGTDLPEQYTIVYKDVTIPDTLSKEHYTFDEWCDDAGLCENPKVISTGSYGTKNLSATWAPEQYDIEYHLTGDMTWPNESGHPDKYTADDNITIATPERRGYDFAGWCARTEDTCAANELQNPYVISAGSFGKLDLWPHWTPATYDITYKLMNGDVIDVNPPLIPATYTYSPTETTALPDTVNLEHYTFVGWHMEQNTTSQTINAIPANTSGPITLYAEMTAETCTITYMDGESTLGTDTYSYGDGFTLTDPNPKSHYDFDGWYDNAGLEGTAITTIAADAPCGKTVWSKWTPIVYTITYYTDSSKTDSYNEYNTTYTVEDADITPLPNPSKNHFSFDGWFDENGQLIDTIYTATGGNRELYATWTQTSCEDGYYLIEDSHTCQQCPSNFANADGMTAKAASACYAVCDETPNCPENSTCVYNSYVNESYIDYNVGPDHEACGINYTCNDYYKNNDDGCEPQDYDIVYHDGETTLNLSPNKHYYGTATTLPDATAAQKEFYNFDGWYNNAELNGTVITEIPANTHEATELWGKWSPKQYDVYYYQGAHGTVANNPVKYENAITYNTIYTTETRAATGITTNTGYTFCGWSQNSSDTCDSATIITEGTTMSSAWQTDDDLRLYAIYSANPYTLTYDCNGGWLASDSNVSTTNTTVYFDGEYELNNSLCERTNYTVNYWECTNDLDTNFNTWNIANNSTCRVIWRDIQYPIEYREPDGSLISGITPLVYSAATNTTVPNANPVDTEYAAFAGWCDDANLTQNCALTREIPVGSNDNPRVFYAKWNATKCAAKQYLDAGVCYGCPSDYPESAAWTDSGIDGCYYNWSCSTECPDNSDCELISGISSGQIYYGSNDTYSCDMNVECHRGYVKQENPVSCALQSYNITYHLNNAHWASDTGHPQTYNVKDSLITIATPERTGYTFDGWCVGNNNDDCDNPVKPFTINPSNTATTLEDITLYAQWTFNGCGDGYTEQETATGKICAKTDYTITYMDRGYKLFGLNGTQTFTVEDEIHLPSVFRQGYNFDGWCVGNDTCDSDDVLTGTQAAGWVGNKILHAQWSEYVEPTPGPQPEPDPDCTSGVLLHIDDTALCLSETQITSPAVAVGKGNKKRYLQMTQKPANGDGLSINKDSNKKLKVMYRGKVYNVHDNTVGEN